MVSPTCDAFPSPRPAPLAWKEFRRRSGLSPQSKVYVYDASPQIVPHSPLINTLSLSPILASSAIGQESPRKDHSGYLVSHVSQALQALGASTGGNIADYIANNFSTEQGAPYERGRKLHYMVNAILSSPKYKYLFLKDQVLKDEKRSLWRLKQPGDTTDDDSLHPTLTLHLGMSLASLLPTTASLSSLIPPTSPSLSLRASMDDMDNLSPATPTQLTTPPSTPISTSIPFKPTSRLNNIVININNMIKSSPLPTATPSTTTSPIASPRDGYGGSNEGEKHMGPRTTEHPPALPSPTSLPYPTVSPSFSPSSLPSSPYPCSPPLGDAPLPALSSRRKKRKGSGLDSSSGVESLSPKQPDEQGGAADEKKRRLDISAA